MLVHATLDDHRVTVLADPAVHEAVGPAGLAEVCRVVNHHMTQPGDTPLTALARGVRAAADGHGTAEARFQV